MTAPGVDLAVDPADVAQAGSAKALLLTVFGEFVQGRGGAWTQSLVAAADALGIGEKNARQALARLRDQGIIESERHGRTVRWTTTPAGAKLLAEGADRIYSFGRSAPEWSGDWLVAHCPVSEEQRALRRQLRSQLGFLGFGELSPSLLVSPHVEREPHLRRVLDELDLGASAIVFRSTSLPGDRAEGEGDRRVVGRAWELDRLEASYRQFVAAHDKPRGAAPTGECAFRALVELVHDWRRFPFEDPELPIELLPADWIGARAAQVFHERHHALSPLGQTWFDTLEG